MARQRVQDRGEGVLAGVYWLMRWIGMGIGRVRFVSGLVRTQVSLLMTTASLLGGCLGLANSSTPSTLPPSAPDSQNSGWQEIAPGLEQRLFSPRRNNPLIQLVAVRVDPAHFTFRAHYQPGQALNLAQWREALPDATAFINANFFDANHQALGLVATDSQLFGQSFVNRGGTVQVLNGQVRVRSNIHEPYAGEPFEQAIQGFPMLVVNSTASYTNTVDRDASRRTAVAQDSAGRILFFVTPLFGITLADLAQFLVEANLDIINAVNLDGGGSSLLALNADTGAQTIGAFDPVPVVLAVYPR